MSLGFQESRIANHILSLKKENGRMIVLFNTEANSNATISLNTILDAGINCATTRNYYFQPYNSGGDVGPEHAVTYIGKIAAETNFGIVNAPITGYFDGSLLKINFNSSTAGVSNIYLYNLNGKLLKESMLNACIGENTAAIDISGIQEKTIFARLTNSGTISTLKIFR